MSQFGGISTLKGVRYEVQFGVYKIPDLLEGLATAIRYQPLTSALSSDQLPQKVFVDDYSVLDAGHKKSFFQVKHNSKDPSWTINRLISEGVLQQFWAQYYIEPECNLFFVSDIPAPNLKNLAEQARQSVSLAEFEQTLNEQMQKDSQQIINKLEINLQDVWLLMKAIDFILLPETNMQTRILDYAGGRYSDPEKFALVVKELIETTAGSLISKDLLEQHLNRKGLFRLPISLTEDIATVLRKASGALKAYKSDIMGVHIPRGETEKLEQWIKTTTKERPVAFLLDIAGTGKSVILHDLLERLESQRVPVLAIKADSLTGVTNATILKDQLNLPASPESLLAAAAKNSMAVLIIDQLDALSLTFSRNQECLNMIIDLIGRSISIPSIRVVVSCRTFDRRFDPILKQIHSTDEFNIEPLNKNQIQQVLYRLNIAWDDLAKREQALLSNPHHLGTFASVAVEINKRGAHRSQVNTIQDLYESLWDTKILNPSTASVSTSHLQDAINRLSDAIHRSQELPQPATILDDLPEVRTYLESEGILLHESNSVKFFHQSFFDYCYARRFVIQSKSLAEDILKGEQGFFVRPQVVQVLTYLRSVDRKRYLSEVETLMDRGPRREWLRQLKMNPNTKGRSLYGISVHIFGSPIRYHLRRLVFSVFGQQINLDQREKAIGLKCLLSDIDRRLFLLGSHGNEEWFDVIYTELAALFRLPDKSLDEDILPFLRSVQENRADKIYSLFANQLVTSDRWRARIVWCLNSYKAWQSKEAEKCLIWLCENEQTPWYTLELALHNVGEVNITLGCQILRCILKRLRDQWLKLDKPPTAEKFSPPEPTDKKGYLSYVDHIHDFDKYAQKLLPSQLLWIEELIKRASSSCPSVLLEILYPWIEDILPKVTWYFTPKGWLRDEVFSSPSLHDSSDPDSAIIQGIRQSLSQLAGTDEEQFLKFAKMIEGSRYLVLHSILAQVLSEQAGKYATWTFQYLLKDKLRFQIGDMASTTLFSRKLIGAVFPHLNTDERIQLEHVILSYYPVWETRPENRRFRGSDQLELLWEVPDSFLTTEGRKTRQELQRKFKCHEPSEAKDIELKAVSSPIPRDRAPFVSDDNWLKAMLKYNDETEWGKPREEILKGGVIELSRTFKEVVKTQPDRFAQLIKQFDQNVSSHYFDSVLSGLAESTVSSNTVFDTCEYSYNKRPDDVIIQKAICDAIEKRINDNVPDSLIEITRNIALYSTDPDHEAWQTATDDGNNYYHGDPFSNGINTARGSAVMVYMKCMLKSPPNDTDVLLTTLERFSDDASSAVRSCLIELLPFALRLNVKRVINIFNRSIESRPELLVCNVSYNFIHYAMGHSVHEMLKHVESLIDSDLEDAREAAGRLAAITYLVTPHGRYLYSRCMRGDVSLRQGVAKVLARNVDRPDLLQKCLIGLRKLMNDPDKKVREKVGEVFEYLPSPVKPIKQFVQSFLNSWSLVDATRSCVKYAERIQLEHPEMSLIIAERIQLELGKDIVDIQKAAALLDNDLVNLAVSIYTHSDALKQKSRAMDIFERVMDLGSHYASRALEAVDR